MTPMVRRILSASGLGSSAEPAPVTLGEDRSRMGRIQILRAVAAVSVICFHETVRAVQLLNHTLLANAFAFGVAGVALFFVISGFIIFTVHRNDIGRPEMLRPYLIKRFIRIYPIYWIVTLVIMPVYLYGYGL